MCEDVLTEEFFAEAFAQDIPPFELMYMWVRWVKACCGVVGACVGVTHVWAPDASAAYALKQVLVASTPL